MKAAVAGGKRVEQEALALLEVAGGIAIAFLRPTVPVIEAAARLYGVIATASDFFADRCALARQVLAEAALAEKIDAAVSALPGALTHEECAAVDAAVKAALSEGKGMIRDALLAIFPGSSGVVAVRGTSRTVERHGRELAGGSRAWRVSVDADGSAWSDWLDLEDAVRFLLRDDQPN